MNLETIVEAAIARLDETNKARETALATSRSLIRQCANAIRATHRHEWEAAAVMLDEADRIAAELRARLSEHSAILNAGYSQDAFKEYAEARLVFAMVRGTEMPSPDQIAVEPAAYLNGLAEAASELRRDALDALRHNDVERAEALLGQMDAIYSDLITVDFPDAITGGIRRTTDQLRAVLERTRGDVTFALRQDRLERRLAATEAAIERAQSNGAG